MGLEDTIEQMHSRMADEMLPAIVASLTEEEKERIRAEVVEATIRKIREGKSSTMRSLLERSEGEVWKMLREHPAVVDAIRESANQLAEACVQAVKAAEGTVRSNLVGRFNKFIRDGF